MDCDYEIRPLTKVDPQNIDDISSLSKQLLPDNPDMSVEKLTQVINNPAAHVFVAVNRQGRIIGMMMLVVFHTLECEHKAFIENLVVDEKERGKGIATALINRAVETAKKLKIKCIHLTSRASRIAANLFYKKLGFVPYETNHYKYEVKPF